MNTVYLMSLDIPDIRYDIFSKVFLQMNVTCHLRQMAHGHGVRCSLHRLQQPERGFAALADADIQSFS